MAAYNSDSDSESSSGFTNAILAKVESFRVSALDSDLLDDSQDGSIGISVTFSRCVENHTGNQKVGKAQAKYAINTEQLREIADNYEGESEYVDLTKDFPEDLAHKTGEAAVLILRDFVSPEDHDRLLDEQAEYDWDTKCIMYNRVVNKRMRSNVCYAKHSQEPNYENGEGTVIAWSSVPLLNNVRKRIQPIVGIPKLLAEGNRYDTRVKKWGIGWHGDTERYVVICLRLGAQVPLYFRCFHQCKAVTKDATTIHLNPGDLYIMSKKAVGHDFKKRSRYTFRHAAGNSKAVALKPKQAFTE